MNCRIQLSPIYVTKWLKLEKLKGPSGLLEANYPVNILKNVPWRQVGSVFYCLLSSSSAGPQDLRGAGAATLLASEAKTLLVCEEESLLAAKQRGIAPKGLTRLAPEDPIRPPLKQTTPLAWKIHLVWPPTTLLDRRAPTQSVHRNSRSLLVPTRRTTLWSRLSRLHASEKLTSRRSKDLILREVVNPTSPGSGAARTPRTPRACPGPLSPRKLKAPRKAACPRLRQPRLPPCCRRRTWRWRGGEQRQSASWRRLCLHGRRRRRCCRRWRSCRARRCGGSAGRPTRRWQRRLRRPQQQRGMKRPPRQHHLRMTTSLRLHDEDFIIEFSQWK